MHIVPNKHFENKDEGKDNNNTLFLFHNKKSVKYINLRNIKNFEEEF